MSSDRLFYKVCIVGDFGVGKSTLLYQYLERRFNANIESTIGSNFFIKNVKLKTLLSDRCPFIGLPPSKVSVLSMVALMMSYFKFGA